MESKSKCDICKRTILKIIKHESETGHIYYICDGCDKFILKDVYGLRKGDVIAKGLALAEEHKLHTPYAMNVVGGKYTINEAKRRTKLKLREIQGKSVDAYSIGMRIAGSYGSRQK